MGGGGRGAGVCLWLNLFGCMNLSVSTGWGGLYWVHELLDVLVLWGAGHACAACEDTCVIYNACMGLVYC